MIREQALGELLAEAGTRAAALAREAMAAGIPADVWEEAQPASSTRSRYGRREYTSRRAGQCSIGFEPALRALGAYSGELLARAHIDDRARGGYFFEVFLTPDFDRVIACFGVARPKTSSASDAPPWTPFDEIVHSRTLQTPDKVAELRGGGLPDVAAGLVVGLERTLAMRQWQNFRRHAELVPAFPAPAAAGPLAEALALVLAEPHPSALLVAIIEDALAAVRVRP